ncbi:flagellar biosynthetic protein FliQ [bacterium]|nr:flagellar biosynthetic protein FliQ [candidate division CSSED10-310 bacterium]
MVVVIEQLLRESLVLCCVVSGPVLGAALVVGFSVSFFQAVTQIQEQTMSYIPKLVVVFVVLLMSFGWMARLLVAFSRKLFSSIAGLPVG